MYCRHQALYLISVMIKTKSASRIPLALKSVLIFARRIARVFNSKEPLMSYYHSMGPNGSIRYCISTPRQAENPLPIIFYIPDHVNTGLYRAKKHFRFLKEICSVTGCIVVSIDFKKVKTSEFQKLLATNRWALRWVSNNLMYYSGDIRNMIISGTGTGAFLARELCFYIREKRTVAIATPSDNLFEPPRTPGYSIFVYPYNDLLETSSWAPLQINRYLSSKEMLLNFYKYINSEVKKRNECLILL